MFEAHLDTEPTVLSCQYAGMTVIGMYMVNGAEDRFVQLVGMDVTRDNLLASLEGVRRIYTNNGSLFGLPFIHGALGTDLTALVDHHELMYDCWRCNLEGGFKTVSSNWAYHGSSGPSADGMQCGGGGNIWTTVTWMPWLHCFSTTERT